MHYAPSLSKSTLLRKLRYNIIAGQESVTTMSGKHYIYTGCPRRNAPDFGRVFLMLNYTNITQNTYVQS